MRKNTESFGDLVQSVTDGLMRVIQRPDANSYQPHDKQLEFHQSTARGRLYIGGNRSGKTVGGIVEDIWWLLGKHPYRETPPPPVRGRLVCVDFPNGFEKIIKPTITQWIPPSCLIDGSWESSYNSRTRTLTLANGSFLEFMSYDQETDAFAGASRHFTHFDEEPPKSIWTECRARLIDTKGDWWISMTPVEGWTWTADDIYEPTKAGLEPDFAVIEVDMTDNTYLSPVEVESFLSGLDDTERAARKSGKFVQIGGLIFKTFVPDIHIIPPVANAPAHARLSGSIDHGLNNPTAVYWHYVTLDNTVVTFFEHYKSEWTIGQHAQKIHGVEQQLGISPPLYWGDPAMRQRNPVNGNSVQLEYRLRNVQVVPSNNDVHAGLNRMMEYQRQGKWFITENCPNLIREMRRYRWKTRESKKLQERHGPMEEPFKKDDHAMDSCRYFFMSMPELPPSPETPADLSGVREEVLRMLRAVTPFNAFTGRIDPGISRRTLATPQEYRVSTDEHMGGEW